MLLLLTLVIPQDTVRLEASVALARALERAPIMAAATARVRAAEALRRDLGRPGNPTLGVLAENIGATREVTGRDGLAGVEGQVTLEFPVPIGGDLGAARAVGRTSAMLAATEAGVTEANLRHEILLELLRHEQSHAVLDAAVEEAATLGEMARAMTVRALEGRNAEGAAARVRIEATMAASAAARRRADAAILDAQLAARLGLPPGTPLRISPGDCQAASPGRTVTQAELAAARVGLAEAETGRARAARVPDLGPVVGYRRTAGFSGLLLGLTMELPFFTGGGARLDAARAWRDAAVAEEERTTQASAATLDGEARALAALDPLVAGYGAAWHADLERTVAAAAARWEEGAGTLAELLEARRARLHALEEAATWALHRVTARLNQARALGAPLDATLLAGRCPGES